MATAPQKQTPDSLALSLYGRTVRFDDFTRTNALEPTFHLALPNGETLQVVKTGEEVGLGYCYEISVSYEGRWQRIGEGWLGGFGVSTEPADVCQFATSYINLFAVPENVLRERFDRAWGR